MIYTFYSYKGGVGRSMALANIAELFYQANLKVLMVDFDLEAPGLERFFADSDEKVKDYKRQPGMINMLLDYKREMTKPLSQEEKETIQQNQTLPFPLEGIREKYCIKLESDKLGGELWLLPAGMRTGNDEDYTRSVLTFNWQDFYDNWEGERFFEWFRAQCLEIADVVLIDSRTGITEMGGISKYQLADLVVLFTVASEQSLEGTYQMVGNLRDQKVDEARGRPLKLLVIPTRVDDSERENINKFSSRFEKQFSTLSKTLGVDLWSLQIPYLSAYAFEEKLAVKINSPGDKKLVNAYGECARVLAAMSPSDSLIHNKLSSGTSVVKGFTYDVYMSYSREQEETAVIIAESLRNAGIRLWFDRWNIIDSPEGRETATEQGIKESRVILCLTSKAWVEQDWQRVKSILTLSQMVIPVRLDGESLPFELSSQPSLMDIPDSKKDQRNFEYKISQLVHLIDPSKDAPKDYREFTRFRPRNEEMMRNNSQPPKVFISYSWDDDDHREWVRTFALRLRADGVAATLDTWHKDTGNSTPEFMERQVRESDFILCICTPLYKERFEERKGGVDYEAELITNEYLVSRNRKKFIPILRKDEWKRSAPSWLMGTYYINLSGDPYNEKNYRELLETLLDIRKNELPIGTAPASNGKPGEDAVFVNREIELATLDPAKLHTTYWQYALISAPTGYGKTRLMKRLLENIQNDPELNDKWAYSYVDMRMSIDSKHAIRYMVEQVTGEPVASDADELLLKEKICNHILEKMSNSSKYGILRHILLIVDSVDFINSATVEWFSSVLHDVIVDSYADYEKDNASFVVRVLIAGTDTETFLQNYSKWEEAAEKYRLKLPQKLSLSAFDDLPVQELVQRQALKEEISLDSATVEEISYGLQYLSGGHPTAVTNILNELANKKFRKYKGFFKENRERLIRNYISDVGNRVLSRFPLPQAKKDIKTVCVYRLINLNTLQRLRDEKLVSAFANINLLAQLCESSILAPPNAEILFYHNNGIRRILYLDLAHGMGKDDEQIQRTHQCARALYREWIQTKHYGLHLFFVEWLFHSLQIATLSNGEILSDWQRLLSLMNPGELPPNVIKDAIHERLNKDGEVKYLFRERFGSTDFSPLFEV